MCTACAVRTPVGYRCKECVRGQREKFYTAQSLDPLLQAGVGFVLGGMAVTLFSLLRLGDLGFIGWLIAFWIGSTVGAFIGDMAHRVVGKRRGKYSYLAAGGGIAFGAVLSLFLFGLSLAPLIFVVMMVSGAVGRLRLGRH